MNSLFSVAVVIRSSGERTEASCRDLILAQGVPPESVFTIMERPFSRALRIGFEIGLAAGKPFTLFVDADLLLRAGSIKGMVDRAKSQPPHVCEIQGYCLDKLFGGVRAGGAHLYRTALLSEVISSIPEDGVAIRPESLALERMAAKGFQRVVVPELIGLHDFDQDPEDIFRKCFVHARKHEPYIPLFVSLWRARAEVDDDYRVALSGLAAGIQYHDPVTIDFDAPYSRPTSGMLLSKKPRLKETDWNLEKVEEVLSSWQEPELFRSHKPFGMVASNASKLAVLLQLFRTQSTGRSLPRALIATLVVVLLRAGKFLDARS